MGAKNHLLPSIHPRHVLFLRDPTSTRSGADVVKTINTPLSCASALAVFPHLAHLGKVLARISSLYLYFMYDLTRPLLLSVTNHVTGQDRHSRRQ